VQHWIYLHILKVFELSRDTCSRPLALPSLYPLDFHDATQAKVRSETQFSFPETFRFPLGNLFLLAPNTIFKKNINYLSTFELNSYKVIIIFVMIKPLHPKLTHAFGYRLSLSASVHCNATKRALLSSSLPVPRRTADENSNYDHFIIEEGSFTVQLTFSDGNCSSSIYLLTFHLCFVSKLQSFCLQITCIHICWSYCFYDIWSLKVSKTKEMQLLTGSSIALQPPISGSPLPNHPFLLHRPPGASFSPPTLGTTGLEQLTACQH